MIRHIYLILFKSLPEHIQLCEMCRARMIDEIPTTVQEPETEGEGVVGVHFRPSVQPRRPRWREAK